MHINRLFPCIYPARSLVLLLSVPHSLPPSARLSPILFISIPSSTPRTPPSPLSHSGSPFFPPADNLKGRQLLHTTYKMFMTAAGVEGKSIYPLCTHALPYIFNKWAYTHCMEMSRSSLTDTRSLWASRTDAPSHALIPTSGLQMLSPY